MTSAIHELDFVSTVAGWANSLIEANRGALPFSRARIETYGKGNRKRRDFTLLDTDGDVCLTGEIKLPWAADGHSPFVESVVLDARKKADNVNAPWFFTWNVNELVLWRRAGFAELGNARTFDRVQIATVRTDADLQNPKIESSIADKVRRFLFDFALILKGEREVERRPPDIYFIHSLESFLERPIQLTKLELDQRYARPAQKHSLDQWMRDGLGWTLGGDDLLMRAAKFANYAIANKLIFYEALRKKFGSLRELKVTERVETGEQLFDLLSSYFDEACHVTGDYETVFGADRNDIGDRVPFYDARVLDSWRELAKHVHLFDFSRLDYDVIGQIFEGLIAPEERHKFGQYYTRPEVVDLINSFCIRGGADRVLDPGCGGGTFLVRAYARKKRLSPRLTHAELLDGVIGVDVSRFATHLSTINLAGRDLIDAANYPRVVRSDFFDLDPAKPILQLPDAKGRMVAVEARGLDAVVGNPPYVRQEEIATDKKKAYGQLVRKTAGFEASGRSDLHCYFWAHASRFLKPDGWLGFLTSSQWLDVEYGFALQKWLLENFRVVAIIESREEPWFVGARVATAATIAQREGNPEARADNIVRFVEMKRPIADSLAGDGTSGGMIAAADLFRDSILSAEGDVETGAYRVRCVRQGDLYDNGVRLSEIIKGETKYLGGKWGIPLRAPDLWYELLAAGGDRWVPCGSIADVKRGITTGADKFFYVTDHTPEALAQFEHKAAFEEHYGAARADVAKGRVKIVRAGTGEAFPIESEFLAPVVHSLMHIDRYVVDLAQCAKLVVMTDKPRAELKGTHLLEYLKWGERHGVPNGSTVNARAAGGRAWYDLTFGRRAGVLWAKSHQYRHCAPLNPERFFANCNLYTVDVREEPLLVSGVLNSTIVQFSKHLFGRPVGVEDNLKTEVIDAQMMPVPDRRRASPKIMQRIVKNAKKLSERSILGSVSEQRLRQKAFTESGRADELSGLSNATEFDQPDRHDLDDAVLELLGVSDREQRDALRLRLYAHLQGYFETVRRKEERGIDNKAKAKRGLKITPDRIAADVFAEIEARQPVLLRRYRDLVNGALGEDVDGLRVPASGTPVVVDDMLNVGVNFMRNKKKGEFIKTRSRAQAELLVRLVALGEKGHHFVPADDKAISDAIKKIDAQIRRRETAIRAMIAERTQHEDLQEKAFALVLSRL